MEAEPIFEGDDFFASPIAAIDGTGSGEHLTLLAIRTKLYIILNEAEAVF